MAEDPWALAGGDLPALLERQARVASRPQLLAAGLSDQELRTLVTSGRWQRGYPGTYIAHNGPLPYMARLWAALLYAGRDAMASHQTAAYLHRILSAAPAQIHLTVPSDRRVVPQAGLVVHLSRRASDQRHVAALPPRTRPEETVLDLVDGCSRPDDVVGLLAAACQRGITTPRRLLASSRLRKKLRWRRLLMEALGGIRSGIESVLEWRYFRDVEQPHGLPRGVRQAVRVRDGRRERHDVKYKGYAVIVELDGQQYHEGEEVFRDMARDNASAADGEAVLRYGYFDVSLRPCQVAAQVVAVLRRAGWTGKFRRCPRCP